ALEHAAAYIEQVDLSIADYMRLYEEYSTKTLEPVAATWQISLDKLRGENRAALDLLKLIAFLAPDNIPRDLLQSSAASAVEFAGAIEGLRRYSLIQTTSTTITVHRLVQQVTREG